MYLYVDFSCVFVWLVQRQKVLANYVYAHGSDGVHGSFEPQRIVPVHYDNDDGAEKHRLSIPNGGEESVR
jgi:hypothetical protein